MSNPLEQQRYFRREDAVDIVGLLAEARVYASMHGSSQGWQITLNGHTDLIAVAKVLELCQAKGKAGVGSSTGESEPVNMLFRPYGGEGWPEVLIYWGSKP